MAGRRHSSNYINRYEIRKRRRTISKKGPWWTPFSCVFLRGRKERSMMKITIYTSLRYTEGERRKKYQGDFSWCNSVLYLRCENFRYLYTFVRIKCWITRCISRSRWKMCEWFFFFFFLTGRISPNKQRDIYYREKNWTVEIFPNITRLRLINPRNQSACVTDL